MKTQVLLALSLAVAATSASAQTGYLGALAGLSRISVDCTAPLTSCRDTDVGFKVYGGYEVMPKVYAELAYTSFGTVSARIGSLEEMYKARAWSLSAAYRHPLPHDLTAVARLGLAMVTTRHTRSYGDRDSSSSVRLYGGLGLDYLLIDNIRLVSSVDLTTGSASGDGMLLYVMGAGVQGEF